MIDLIERYVKKKSTNVTELCCSLPPNCGNITMPVGQSLLTSSLGIPEFLLTHPDPEKVCRQHERNILGKQDFSQVLVV